MNADGADKPAFRGAMVEKSVPQMIQQETTLVTAASSHLQRLHDRCYPS